MRSGQKYSLMDINNYCLLTDPTGLGYSYTTEYEQLGDTFVENFGKITQGQIPATVNFLSYDNFRDFVNFIEGSESLRFAYKIPFKDGAKEYLKDVKIQSLTKSQIQTNGVISESIVFDCLSLWYEENTIVYNVTSQTNEIRWDFKWDSRFIDYNVRNLKYINKGHVEAPVSIEIDGPLRSPLIELYVEGELYQTIEIMREFSQYEKLLYDSRVNKFFIGMQNEDGTQSDLFSLDYIKFENDNVLRLPKNRSCEIKLKAENNIINAKITIFPQYRIV